MRHRMEPAGEGLWRCSTCGVEVRSPSSEPEEPEEGVLAMAGPGWRTTADVLPCATGLVLRVMRW